MIRELLSCCLLALGMAGAIRVPAAEPAPAGVSQKAAWRLFPARPLAEVREDGVTYRGHWTRWTSTGPSGERLFCATSPKSSASFEFSGDRVACIHKVGPD